MLEYDPYKSPRWRAIRRRHRTIDMIIILMSIILVLCLT